MNDLRIREATENDLPILLELYGRAFQSAAILSLPNAKKIYSEYSKYPHYKLYVGEISEKIVGTFALLIMHNLGGTGEPSGVVEDVAVDPDYQKRGIGRKMMQFALERCREARCYKMMLSSNSKRKEAHQFYEGLGFARHGYSYLIEL